ncbi:MAG: cation diffusion facilitator family transporter, partial [Gammaproteobacteria bacterium]|nr:cation diffusion facilitator family transporter [Gammaproteobacteria bacterium]
MRAVTVVGAIVNLLLSVAKILAGYIGQSQALIADGVHSLSDLVSDALVLMAAKHGSQDADDDHPYGHARIETAATVGLGALLLVVAAGIGWDALRRMFNPDLLLHPGMMALVVAFISIL